MSGDTHETTFEEFEAEDFDAYSPEKWSSNVFTLGRRKVKNKLELIGRALESELAEASLELTKHLSDEFPSLWNKKQVDTQWLFFSRDEAARAQLTDLIDKERTLADSLADPTPRYRHLFLGIALDHDRLEIGLRLHHDAWADRRNLSNLLAEQEGRSGFKELLAALPEHYEAELSDGTAASPGSFGDEQIEELAVEFQERKGWLFVGARLPRDQVLILGEELIDTAREVFRFLAPVYRFIAWSPENDAISLDRLVAERHEALKASREEHDRERAEREAERTKRQAEGQKMREEIAEKFLATQAWRQREMAARRAATARAEAETRESDARAQAEALAAKMGLGGDPTPAKPDEPAPRTAQPTSDGRPSRPRPRPQRDDRGAAPAPQVSAERAAQIVVGDLVEVKKGFLMGRRGVVQEIDEKGGLKVSFGALSSRLTAYDVSGHGPAPAGRGREGGGGRKRRGDQRGPRNRFRGRVPGDGGSGGGTPS